MSQPRLPRASHIPPPPDGAGIPPRETLLAFGDSWALGWASPVLFAVFFAEPSAEDFERFLAAQAKDIDEWPSWQTRSVLYHGAANSTLGAAQRQAAADMLNARADKLRAICAGYVFCTESGLARGVLKVINWLAPPPYPSFQATSVSEGLTLLRQIDPRIEPTSLLRKYHTLFADYLQRVSPSRASVRPLAVKP